MTKTRAEALHWVEEVKAGLAQRPDAHVRPFVLPPLTAVAEVAAACRGIADGAPPLLVGAQNAHWEDVGPWTGEVAVSQVADAGCSLVMVGHSDRRHHFGESDEIVAAKVRAVLRHGLRVVLCVGEPAAVRDAGRHVDHVLGQVASALDGVDDVSSVLVAYEPVWAIGCAGTVATPADLAPVMAALVDRWGDALAGRLYGGSVTPSNAAAVLGVPGVDGLFAGRSAWTAQGFLSLVDRAASRPPTGQAMGSSAP
jgi:triosephosphate isomerase